jgi:glycosyltransferase involved in cell wall biosynthesis
MNIWYFHPYGGGPGIGRFWRPYHLGRAWNRAGHSVTVFPARYHHLLDDKTPLPNETEVGGVRYVAVNARTYAGNGMSRILNMLDYCFSMLSLAKQVGRELQKPDLIVVSSPHPFGIYPGSWLARKFGAKLIFEVRDLWPLSLTELGGMPKWHPLVILTGFTERYAYRRADLVASLMTGAEGFMRARGLAPGKFVPAPNGVDDTAPPQTMEPKTQPGQAAAKTIERWKGEGKVILIHPGAQGLPNALGRLLDAVALLPQAARKRLGVVLIGKGERTEALKQQAHDLELDNVAFFDLIPKGEADWLTSMSDIGYAGGTNQTGIQRYGISPNKVMDYMNLGVPTILPMTSEPNPISESGAGLTCDGNEPRNIADAITAMMTMSAPERAQLGERGRRYVRAELGFSRIAKRYLR